MPNENVSTQESSNVNNANSYQQSYTTPNQYGPYNQYNGNVPGAYPAPVTVEPQKPRSAYVAGLLHLIFPFFGIGYYYRGMDEKGRNCWIMAIVGILTSFIFGIGSILLVIVEIINIVEAVKLFKGDITVDAKGRTLYPDF